MKKVLIVALLFGFLTSAAIGLAETYLPNAAAKGIVIDALAFPGAAIASLYYSEGVHTGRGAPSWGYAVIIFNYLVYALFWLLVLMTARFFRRRRRDDSGGTAISRSRV
jgi:MYXO-CTERM domain-containing protein